MIARFWHKLFGHKWIESAFVLPANPDRGQYVTITQLIRRCNCGAVQSAQVMGNPVEAARNATGTTADSEIDALRRLAGLDPGAPFNERK